MFDWLVVRWQWPAAALFGAVLLTALTPMFAAGRDIAVVLVYLQLPAYFLHQYEEHRGDQFRAYINGVVFGGVEALTKSDAFLINFLAVWLLDLIAIALAVFVAPGWGVVATDLAVLNGIVHVAFAIAKRAYNPGTWTALGLFFPLGGGTLAYLSAHGATAAQHAAGIATAILIHVAIVALANVRAASARTVRAR